MATPHGVPPILVKMDMIDPNIPALLGIDVPDNESRTVVHRPTRGIGEEHYLFIYYGLSPHSGNPVTRVVRAVLAANLARPAAYPGYLDPYPLAPPNKPTNFGLDQLAFCRFPTILFIILGSPSPFLRLKSR